MYKDNYKEKIYLLTLGIFLVLLPYKSSINNIGLICLALGWLINFKKENFISNINEYKPLYLVVLGFYIYFVIRGIDFTSEDFIFPNALKEIGRKSSLIFLPLLIDIQTIRKKIKIINKAYFFGVLIAIGICILNAFYINLLEGLSVNRGLKHFNAWYFSNHLLVKPIKLHPTLFSLMCSVLLHINILSIINILPKKNAIFKNKIVTLITSLFLFGFMLMLSSRTILIASIISLSGIFLFHSIRKRRIAIIGYFLLIVISLVTLELSVNHVNRKRFVDLISFYEKENTSFGGSSFRLKCFKALKDEIIETNYIWGIGSGRKQETFNEAYKKHNLDIAAKGNYNAHNQFLETLIYNGIIGIILLFLIYMISFFKSIKSRNILGINMCFMFFSVSLTESIFEIQKGLWLFSSIFWIYFFINQNKTSESNYNEETK